MELIAAGIVTVIAYACMEVLWLMLIILHTGVRRVLSNRAETSVILLYTVIIKVFFLAGRAPHTKTSLYTKPS